MSSVGKWLSAALDDPLVCEEMKRDVEEWFASGGDDYERYRHALHEIAEEWAGAECGEPVYAQEAYAIGLAKRMYSIAAKALKP